MNDIQKLRYELARARREVVGTLLCRRAIEALAACPNEQAVQGLLDLAIAELNALRDPEIRRLELASD
jgi:hypothetical protein